MKPFSPDGWVYDPENHATVLGQLPKELFLRSPITTLIDVLNSGGGKALGLAICDRIAEGSSNLRVPSWISLPKFFPWHSPPQRVLDWIAERDNQLKVRSSTRNEDWICGRSGEQTSRTIRDKSRVLLHASEISGNQHPIVLQEFVEGIGIVLDIAYSQILRRTIVRVSTGREFVSDTGEHIFTSATQDHEGRHEVIDPMSVEYVLEKCIGELFTGSCLSLPLRRIAEELWKRVNELGFSFGLQAELVVHPNNPEVWNLVQIRPSPSRVRSLGQVFSPLENPLVTTPAVSTRFEHKNRAGLTTEESRKWILAAAAGGVNQAKVIHEYTFNAPQILVWENDPNTDYNLWMLEAAFSAGAQVQITRRVIAINTTHGTPSQTLSPDHDMIIESGGVIALPDMIHQQVVEQLLQGDKNIHAVSDGLIGQIAFY